MIKLKDLLNEESYKVAGRPVTLIKGKKSDATDWKVKFENIRKIWIKRTPENEEENKKKVEEQRIKDRLYHLYLEKKFNPKIDKLVIVPIFQTMKRAGALQAELVLN